jgi:hypothetical protein
MENFLPYDQDHSLNRWQYFSGSFWVAKKSLMEEIPQDERLTHGYGEDVAWSCAYRQKYQFSMNINSSVTLMKDKDPVFFDIRPEVLAKMKEYAQGLK